MRTIREFVALYFSISILGSIDVSAEVVFSFSELLSVITVISSVAFSVNRELLITSSSTSSGTEREAPSDWDFSITTSSMLLF